MGAHAGDVASTSLPDDAWDAAAREAWDALCRAMESKDQRAYREAHGRWFSALTGVPEEFFREFDELPWREWRAVMGKMRRARLRALRRASRSGMGPLLCEVRFNSNRPAECFSRSGTSIPVRSGSAHATRGRGASTVRVVGLELRRLVAASAAVIRPATRTERVLVPA
jgi:hypothetical protein